jgi:hypothetical protein
MPMIIPKGVSKMPVPNMQARWAYLTGDTLQDNPYPIGSSEGLAWMTNWFQEQRDLEESVEALCQERGRIGK